MIAPIEKMSITDRAIENIRSYIQEPGRHAGEKLPTEQVLCQQLGVGRSTVREALRVLQTMGYVSIIHGKGAFIKSVTPTSEVAEQWFTENSYTLSDIFNVRIALEKLIARLAAEKITKEELAALVTNIKDMEAAVCQPPEYSNPNLLAQLDREFHMLICQSTRNGFLIEIYKQVSNSLAVYRVNSFAIFKNQQNVIAPHQKIINALIQHDADTAAIEMTEHLLISKRDMLGAAGSTNG